MRTSLSRGHKAWQGLTLTLADDADDYDLSDPACWVALELHRLGGSAPAPVLLTALELHNYPDPYALVIEAITYEPRAFAWAHL